MPYKGAIAANVVLGVVVAAGVPPLAADRARAAVDAVVGSADGEITLWGREQDGVVTIGIRGGGEEWLSAASAILEAYDPTAEDGELQFSVRRTQLHSV
jgi:hypothetical protein